MKVFFTLNMSKGCLLNILRIWQLIKVSSVIQEWISLLGLVSIFLVNELKIYNNKILVFIMPNTLFSLQNQHIRAN
jgi:hypothetical protein